MLGLQRGSTSSCDHEYRGTCCMQVRLSHRKASTSCHQQRVGSTFSERAEIECTFARKHTFK